MGFPCRWRWASQRRFMARPPSMAASLEPVVGQPMAPLDRGGVPEIGHHAGAAGFDLLADAQIHQGVHFVLHPGLAEGGQVLAGMAIQHQLVANRGEHGAGIVLLAGEMALRQGHREIGGGIDVVIQGLSGRRFVVEGHRSQLRLPGPCRRRALLAGRVRWTGPACASALILPIPPETMSGPA